MRRLFPSICLALLLLAACPGSNTPTQTPTPQSSLSAADLATLVIPPGADTAGVLEKLERAAEAGDAARAWTRAHYLLDLFDAARFGSDPASRSLLAQLVGRPKTSMRGPGATQAIAELLVLEMDHVLELDREMAEAQQAHILATYDAAPIAERAQAFQRIQEIKRVVARDGALAANARLRLFAYCRVALQDAAQSGGRARRVALSHCLYPLFSSDPAPYFADKPEHRPPPPSAPRLHQKLADLLEKREEGRLRLAFAAQRDWHRGFAAKAKAMPPLDALALRLPPSPRAQIFDDFPIFAPSQVAPSQAVDEAAAVQGPLLADGRGVLALSLPSEAPSSATLEGAGIAARAGAAELAVLVKTQQALSVPKGDYWSGESVDAVMSRVGQLRLSLALIEHSSKRRETAAAKAMRWDPSRATLELHLLIAPKQWRLQGKHGVLASIDTSASEARPEDALRSALAELRRAFPDEDGLILVPDAQSSHSALVAAADAARLDALGKPLFSQLALRAEAPKIREKRLRRRVALRARAQVAVSPAAAEPRAVIARRCYLRVLDTSSLAQGEVRLERGQEGIEVTTASRAKIPRALSACATKAFAGLMLDQKIDALQVRFSVQPK